MSDKAIRIECEAADLIELDELSGFQGALKALSDEDHAKLRNVILEYGFSAPIIAWRDADKRHVLDGHQRMKVLHGLREEGYRIPPLPVSWVTARSKAEAKRKLLTIASSYGKMTKKGLVVFLDDVPLVEAMPELRLPEVNLPATFGIDADETDDAVPELEDISAVTKKGDLYVLGRHRLLCGDSSSVEHLDELLAGADIHLVNTDPPYNVKVEPRSNNAIAAGRSSFPATSPDHHHQDFDVARFPGKAKPTTTALRAKDRALRNDFMSEEDYDKQLRAWFGQIARVLVAGRGFYIWGGYANLANYPAPLGESGLHFAQAIIWVKGHPVMGRKDFMSDHEWCFYGWRSGAAHYFHPDIKNATDVWQVKKVPPVKMVHLTEKPVELASRAIHYSSKPNENVLDLFGGSGSTLIAAEKEGRSAFLMELEPLYCDVIVKRYRDWCAANDREAVVKRNGQLVAS